MSSRASLKKWAQRLGPWLVAAAIVFVLSRRYEPAAVLAQMRAGNWQATLPYAIAFPFCYLFPHAFWDTLVLRRALAAPGVKLPRYRDLLRGRAGTAVLMLLGYVFGHGGFGVWLAKSTKASARAVSGVVLYTMLSDLAALSLVATAGTIVGRAEVPGSVRTAAVSIACVTISLVLIGPFALARTSAPFLAAWRDLPRRLALVQIAGRALDIGLGVLLTWVGTRAFGLTIPFVQFATYMPVVLLVTSLPFNVGGIGAAQAAWLVFLPWASGEQILAFQLLWQVFFGVGIVIRGAPFIRGVVREISTPAAAETSVL
jgi:hypothetical protein